MEYFNSEGYFVAEIDGVTITFVNYSEYLEYIKDRENSESEQQQ